MSYTKAYEKLRYLLKTGILLLIREVLKQTNVLPRPLIKIVVIKLIQSIKSPDIIAKLHLRDFLDLFNIKINDCTHIPKLTSVKEIFDDFFQNPLFELSLALDNSIPVDSIFDSLRAIKFTNNEIKQIISTTYKFRFNFLFSKNIKKIPKRISHTLVGLKKKFAFG